MLEKPDKIFPCDCMGEGIVVTAIFEGKDDDHVAVTRDGKKENEMQYYTVELSFWGIGPYDDGKLSWWKRLLACRYILKYGHPWTDMVGMAPKVAKNLANNILYKVEQIQHKIDNKHDELVKQQVEKGLENVDTAFESLGFYKDETWKDMDHSKNVESGSVLKPGKHGVKEVELDLSHLSVKTDCCPECGCKETTHDNLLGEGSRQCEECGQEWWLDIEYAQPKEEYPHPMLCFQHGGSVGCEKINEAHGFICPKCCRDGWTSQKDLHNAEALGTPEDQDNEAVRQDQAPDPKDDWKNTRVFFECGCGLKEVTVLSNKHLNQLIECGTSSCSVCGSTSNLQLTKKTSVEPPASSNASGSANTD